MAPTRDYYYEIDDRGVLTLDGIIQDDPWFVDFFFRRLAPTANPHYPDHPFVSRCGDEMNYLRPSDTPIVYTSFDGARLGYAHSLSMPFYPDRLSYSDDGVLYYDAPVGGVGRIVPQVAMELSRWIEPWGPFYAMRDPSDQRLTPFLPTAQKTRYRVLYPRKDNGCIGCGGANPHGFGLSFVFDQEHETVMTYLRPDERMQGGQRVMHGGYISFLLDETMGKCMSVLGLRAPTAKLNVNFRRPMRLYEEHEIRAWVERQEGRKNFLRGEIRSAGSGAVVADANALFITIGTKDPT